MYAGNFIRAAAPTFKLVGRTTIQKDVIKMFDSERKILKNMLEDNDSKYSFTTDAWTSRTNLAFMSVTIHWINESWKLREKTLDFPKLKGSHTGANLAAVFSKLLEDFNIAPQRFLSMTTDNASNNSTMMEELTARFEMKGVTISPAQNWIPCIAHTMNLAVQDALSLLKIMPSDEVLEDDDTPGTGIPAVARLRKMIVKVSKLLHPGKQIDRVITLTASLN